VTFYLYVGGHAYLSPGLSACIQVQQRVWFTKLMRLQFTLCWRLWHRLAYAATIVFHRAHCRKYVSASFMSE